MITINLTKNQLTTLIDLVLGPICVTLGVTDAAHNTILNMLLIIIPFISTIISEKFPDNTIITAQNLENFDNNLNESDDDGI